MMGQGSAALLPRLDGAAVKHQIKGEDPRSAVLARTLIELGIADPRGWQRSVSGYLEATLKHWVRQHGGDIARDEFSLDVTLSNTPNSYSGEDLDPNLLYLTVGANAAGYIVAGPTLDLLKRIDPRLPVTLYDLAVGAIGRWVRVYDYRDALERVEMWKEWIEDEENADEYEIPDVEGSIPAEMKEEPLEMECLEQLVRGLKDQTVRRLIEAAVDLDKFSRTTTSPEISEATREAFMDSNPPLPALLVSFQRHDAIMACFDEASETMMEAESGPSFLAEVNPGDARSVCHAFNRLATVCETLEAATRWMALLPGNEEGKEA